MPFYYKLRHWRSDSQVKKETKDRTIQNLLRLRRHLRTTVPRSDLNNNLLLATWNIREFDSGAYGDRLDESLYYIAEIIAAFDIVAIQEVNREMKGLEDVMDILGKDWKYVVSDTTEGAQGNDERIAYVYNSRKVKFGGLAGQLVLPPKVERVPDPDKPGKTKKKVTHMEQLWRTPLICGFTAGWAKFQLCNVHIQWGESELSRKQEIDHVAHFLKDRTEDETAWARKIILLGDFNISSVNSPAFKALKEAEYVSPGAHENLFTTKGKSQSQYDRIFIRERADQFEIMSGGTVDMFDLLFRDEEEETYEPFMLTQSGNKAKRYHHWRTHQLSDHQPLWVEFKIDFSDEYLGGLNQPA